MRVVVAAPWAAVAVDVHEPATARVLSEVFRAMRPFSSGVADTAKVIATITPAGGEMVEIHIRSGIETRRAGMAAALEAAMRVNGSLLAACPHLAIHAAVVGATGGVLVVPAESGFGKSTLVGACMARGFGYVSDEALVLSDEGAAVPYPRPLGMSPWSVATVGLSGPGYPRGDGLDAGEEMLVDPLGVGRVETSGSLQVRAILVPRRDNNGGGPPRLAKLPRSAGVVALLGNAFNHYRRPGPAVQLVRDVVAEAEVFALSVGEPLATADLLAAEFGTGEPLTGGLNPLTTVG